MHAKPDGVKQRLTNIREGLASAFQQHAPKGNIAAFTAAVRAQIQEAYDLGVRVGQGKTADDAPAEPTKAKTADADLPQEFPDEQVAETAEPAPTEPTP